MQVSICTVGDELLAGDVVDTNAAWLAARLDERGVRVREIVTVPDETAVVSARIRALRDRTDAVIVTGGVGGTPDDVTMDAVADAFDSSLTVHEAVAADVREALEADDRDLEAAVERWSALPADADPIPNDAGLSPGCILENVYVFPGIPSEMKAMFERVADAFDGERRSATLRSEKPESHLVDTLDRANEAFDVAVGSYPEADGEKRIVIRGERAEPVQAAREWLDERV